ncbi:zinc finger CCCH domain-containing protein 13-like [Nilaparvata lugens]|uniref:zinc finger CCCH domain-containing protein 13-like n=1 Tax=Nilaparvata lugens TaxID=108931 RepID=UPI00193DD28F|nr:zinc finger CCCH domain-containing protein 13-like [Nilaparvata lugens]
MDNTNPDSSVSHPDAHHSEPVTSVAAIPDASTPPTTSSPHTAPQIPKTEETLVQEDTHRPAMTAQEFAIHRRITERLSRMLAQMDKDSEERARDREERNKDREERKRKWQEEMDKDSEERKRDREEWERKQQEERDRYREEQKERERKRQEERERYREEQKERERKRQEERDKDREERKRYREEQREWFKQKMRESSQLENPTTTTTEEAEARCAIIATKIADMLGLEKSEHTGATKDVIVKSDQVSNKLGTTTEETSQITAPASKYDTSMGDKPTQHVYVEADPYLAENREEPEDAIHQSEGQPRPSTANNNSNQQHQRENIINTDPEQDRKPENIEKKSSPEDNVAMDVDQPMKIEEVQKPLDMDIDLPKTDGIKPQVASFKEDVVVKPPEDVVCKNEDVDGEIRRGVRKEEETARSNYEEEVRREEDRSNFSEDVRKIEENNLTNNDQSFQTCLPLEITSTKTEGTSQIMAPANNYSTSMEDQPTQHVHVGADPYPAEHREEPEDAIHQSEGQPEPSMAGITNPPKTPPVTDKTGKHHNLSHYHKTKATNFKYTQLLSENKCKPTKSAIPTSKHQPRRLMFGKRQRHTRPKQRPAAEKEFRTWDQPYDFRRNRRRNQHRKARRWKKRRKKCTRRRPHARFKPHRQKDAQTMDKNHCEEAYQMDHNDRPQDEGQKATDGMHRRHIRFKQAAYLCDHQNRKDNWNRPENKRKEIMDYCYWKENNMDYQMELLDIEMCCVKSKRLMSCMWEMKYARCSPNAACLEPAETTSTNVHCLPNTKHPSTLLVIRPVCEVFAECRMPGAG